jgi:hypothetical protein
MREKTVSLPVSFYEDILEFFYLTRNYRWVEAIDHNGEDKSLRALHTKISFQIWEKDKRLSAHRAYSDLKQSESDGSPDYEQRLWNREYERIRNMTTDEWIKSQSGLH